MKKMSPWWRPRINPMIVIQQPTKPSRRADKPISVRRQLAAAWRWLARGDAEITIRLADNAELRRLNAQFRGKRCVTDVLSFPYPRAGGRGDGDVVIGLGVAATQARRRRVAV